MYFHTAHLLLIFQKCLRYDQCHFYKLEWPFNETMPTYISLPFWLIDQSISQNLNQTFHDRRSIEIGVSPWSSVCRDYNFNGISHTLSKIYSIDNFPLLKVIYDTFFHSVSFNCFERTLLKTHNNLFNSQRSFISINTFFGTRAINVHFDAKAFWVQNLWTSSK